MNSLQCLRLTSYSSARGKICDADMLLFRPRDLIGMIIANRSFVPVEWEFGFSVPHCHVARAVYWGDSLWAVQQTFNPYKHLERLSLLVQKYPGLIDVYGLRPDLEGGYDRRRAIEYHKDICLQPYGWRNIARLVPRHLPGLRRMGWPRCRDDLSKSLRPPFCSMAYSMSDREGGVDPCPGLADYETEPRDLAESLAYEYKLTLV